MTHHEEAVHHKTLLIDARRAGLVAVCVVFTSLMVLAGPAFGLRGHVFERTLGGAGTGDGQFENPQGVAVNEETGQVYVLDQGNNRIERFSSAGVYESQFNGSETPAKAFVFLDELGGVGALGLNDGIAVDNSCYFKKTTGSSCSDLSNGDVYVTDYGNEVVDKFAPDGLYLGQLNETSGGAAFKFKAPSGVGVDTTGIVWIYEGNGQYARGRTISFTDDPQSTFIAGSREFEDPTARSGGFPVTGFAVDSKDDFYGRHLFVEENNSSAFNIAKSAFSGQFLAEPHAAEASEEATGVAVDLSNDAVFIDNVGSVSSFSAGGAFGERLGAGELVDGSGLAVRHASETIYVADAATDVVDIFSPEPPGSPLVEGEGDSAVGSTSATLEAEVDPRGATSEFHLEYGLCATAVTCGASSYTASVPVPDGVVGSDFEVHTVRIHVQDLQPDAVYHFRVVVHNEVKSELHTVYGADRTFTTQASGTALALPDGRAWELVSPVDKQGAQISPISEATLAQSSVLGDSATYVAFKPTESGVAGYSEAVQVISTRGGSGWSSRDVPLPHGAAVGPSVGTGYEYRFFSEDLSSALVEPQGPFTSLAPEASPPDSEHTVYVRHNLTCVSAPGSCFEPLVTGAPGYSDVPEGTKFGGNPEANSGLVKFVGGTPDLAHVILSSNLQLTSTQTNNKVGGLYEWSAGMSPSNELQLVSVLPNGKPATEAAQLGYGPKMARDAVSADGSRVVWSENNGHLYLRDMRMGKTVELDTVQGGSGEGEAVPQLQVAASDGSRVFFTDEQRLTADSGGKGGQSDLYECAIAEMAGELTCRLSDLTSLNAAHESANVQGGVLGASENGSWVYFVANAVLAQGAGTGKCNLGKSSANATCNLYVWHEGVTRLVAIVSGDDYPDWAGDTRGSALNGLTARVSADGQWLAFMSDRSLTGYDTHDAVSGKQDEEVYLYDAGASGGTDGVVCASCSPTGARPAGVEYVRLNGGLVGGNGVWGLPQWIAANIPGWTPFELQNALYQSRYLSDSGRLFFNSGDALVPQDINNNQDVYEYEPVGVGDCSAGLVTFSTSADGCVGLISSGTASGESAFLDASGDGSDVFFLSSEKLVSQDVDKALDVYDAHVCSTVLPCVSAPVAPPECTTADACRSAPAPQPSIFGAPSSATFSGAGNVTPSSPEPAIKPRALTRTQRLARALSTCHKKVRAKRRVCERQARQRYGAKVAGKANSPKKGRDHRG